MKLRCWIGRFILLLLCSIMVSSCQTSDDATAAAKQLSTTSTDLANYYSALSQIVTNTITLGGLQNNLYPHADVLPFPDTNRVLLSATLSELQKRASVAKALQDVSNAFSNLTGSTAPTDVSNAASKLGTELTTLGALPQSTASPVPVPSAIGNASKVIVSLIQQHEEKKIAPALDATVNALRELFSKEKDAYDSLNQTYLSKAASLAKYCISKNLVDETSVLTPALQPFNLTVGHFSTEDVALLRSAAETQIQETNTKLSAAHNSASDAMLQAITEMSTRIHQLAQGSSMPTRGAPVTLTTVEGWINAAGTFLSTTGSATPATTKK